MNGLLYLLLGLRLVGGTGDGIAWNGGEGGESLGEGGGGGALRQRRLPLRV